jgi:Flp pilus assembly protein TadD
MLEADVQNEGKENAESWVLLGKMYQEDDQDVFAIMALKQAYELDPYDLEALLHLGISCCNELEQTQALRNLKMWLKTHPDYCSLPDIHSENIEIDIVQDKFREAHMLKPNDSNVLLALGVLSFIKRDNQTAHMYFEKAIKENPTDHTLWNKYGAAMANTMKNDEAMVSYKQAL